MPEIRERVYQSPVLLPLDKRQTHSLPQRGVGSAHKATGNYTRSSVKVKAVESAPTFRPPHALDSLEEIERFCSRLSPKNQPARQASEKLSDQKLSLRKSLDEPVRSLLNIKQPVHDPNESYTSLPQSPSTPDSAVDTVDVIMKRLERLQTSLRDFENEARGQALARSNSESSEPDVVDEANPLAYTPAHISSPRSLKISTFCTEFDDERLRENLCEVERIADELRQAALGRQLLKRESSETKQRLGTSKNSETCVSAEQLSEIKHTNQRHERWPAVSKPNFVNDDFTMDSMPDAKELAKLRKRFEGRIDEAQMMESIFQNITAVTELCSAIKNNRARPTMQQDSTLQKQWTRYLHATGQIG